MKRDLRFNHYAIQKRQNLLVFRVEQSHRDRKQNMVRTKRAKQLSWDVCQTIAHLSKNGVKLCVIAKSLEIHLSTVSKALKWYYERRTSVIREKRGWKFKLYPRNLRLLR